MVSVKRLNGSNGIWLIIKKDAKMETPYKIESHVKSLSVPIFFIFSFSERNTPLTPKPSNATLITINAK